MKTHNIKQIAIMLILILSISLVIIVPLSEARTNYYGNYYSYWVRTHTVRYTPTPTPTPTSTLTPTPTDTPTVTPTPIPTPIIVSSPDSFQSPPGQSVINWSGITWYVRSGTGTPGPNSWTNQNVWIDNQSRLHLKITNINGIWYSSEVDSLFPVGYGTYTFDVASNPNVYADNVVAGLFYYLDDHNEIDFMEFSNWNGAAMLNSQSSVHASTGDFQSIPYNTNSMNNTLTYIWTPSSIVFQYNGVQMWEYTGTIPRLGGTLDINLWLYKTPVPADGNEQELILNSVQYMPSS